MKFQHGICLAICLASMVIMGLVGCKKDEKSQAPPIDGTPYLLADRPQEVQQVKQFLAAAQDGDQVAVVGRIGGEVKPWVEGLAMFNIVDTSLVPCNEIPGDQCPNPWDYCCASDLAEGRTSVKVVDKQGEIVAEDARRLLSVTELQTVVIQGTARRDQNGNVTLEAHGVFVQP